MPKTKHYKKNKIIMICALTLGALVSYIPAMAQPPTDEISILPAKSITEILSDNEITHPAMKLTPDKSELVRLDDQASSVIVGNPAHLSILAENSQLLVLIPRLPGATYMTVLNNKGEVIMQRHVIVASPKEKYVRIRQTCAASDNEDCQKTQVYYCPDTCHPIAAAPEEKSSSDSAASGEGNTANTAPSYANTAEEGTPE